MTLVVPLQPDEEVEAGLDRPAEGIKIAGRIPQRKLSHHVDVEAGASLRGRSLRAFLPFAHSPNRNVSVPIERTLPHRPYRLISSSFVVSARAALAAGKEDQEDEERGHRAHPAPIGSSWGRLNEHPAHVCRRSEP
jgi:hypothetical protein